MLDSSDEMYVYTFSFNVRSPVSLSGEELRALTQDCVEYLEPFVQERVPKTRTLIQRICELFD